MHARRLVSFVYLYPGQTLTETSSGFYVQQSGISVQRDTGDESFPLSELAAEVSEVAKITVVYQDLPQEEYEKALLKFGLPMPIAAMLADSDVGAAKGDLDSQSGDLRSLIGRPAEWRGRRAAVVCTSEARKIEVPLVARQGRSP